MSRLTSKVAIALGSFLAVVILASVHVSCGPSTSTKVFDELGEVERQYANASNATAARSILLAHREKILGWQRAGVTGLDYDVTLALTEARLYALECIEGDRESAEIFFQECTNHLSSSQGKKGLPFREFSREQVLQIAGIADSNSVVRWRQERPRDGEEGATPKDGVQR